jgi:DoxX-like family
MPEAKISTTALRLGTLLTVLSILALVGNGLYTLLGPREAIREMVEMGGMTLAQATPVALIGIVCGVVYGVPRTAILGAILTTGFYGGAAAIEFRIGGTPYLWVNILLAAMAWGGLYLRDARLRSLLPLTQSIGS